MASLSNKVIVITGAAGRLGRRVVQRFAREGATVVAIVGNEDDARRIPFPEDAEGWAFPVDVTDEELVQACFEQIGRQFSTMHALIHTVGGWDAKPFLETSKTDFDRIMGINLDSAFLCFREAARLMSVSGSGGPLIGIASGQGADGGVMEQAAYSAAKAGVIRLVESVADEFQGTGITAHAIAPSTILYEAEGRGVPVDDIVELCHSLITRTGRALNGATLKAYG